MNKRKADIIRQTIRKYDGSMWMASYGYVLNANGEIDKVRMSNAKHELYATAEEVRQALRQGGGQG